jgi:hypothetical protein
MKKRRIIKDNPCFKVISNENISFCVSGYHSREVEAAVGEHRNPEVNCLLNYCELKHNGVKSNITRCGRHSGSESKDLENASKYKWR